MPLANFPVKSRTPIRATEFKLPPQQAKREHRGARVYEPKSPVVSRPESARVYDRPTPILTLPGLPSSPVTLNIPRNAKSSGFASKILKTSKEWFGQIKAPFVKDPLTPKIPPTPKTADWQKETWANEAPPSTPYSATKAIFGSLQKKKAIRHKHKHNASDESEELRKDPPPLYTKYVEEGGRKAWMSVAGAFLVQFCTVGYLFTWNIFEDFYSHHFLTDQNPIAIRFIGSLQWFLAFFLALVGGKLADLGYFAHVVIGGSLFFTCCVFLLSILDEEQFGAILACHGLGMGIGVGLVFVPTATIVSRYFVRRRGLAIGIAMSGGPFGGMIFTTILRALLPSRGFGSSVRITAFVIVPLLVAGYLLMMKPPEETKTTSSIRLDLARYSKELEYLAAAAGTSLGLLFVCYPAFYLELSGLEHDVHLAVAGMAPMVVSLTGVIGSVLFGFASDKLGVWNMLAIVNGFLALFMFGMGSIGNQGSLIGFSIFYGLFLASWFSLTVTALVSLATRPRETGTRVGIVFSIASFGCLFAALLQNAVLGASLEWGRLSAIAGIIFLVVMGLAVYSRMIRSVKIVVRKRKYLARIEYLQII